MSILPLPTPCEHTHQVCENKALIEAALDRCKNVGLRRTKALQDVLHILVEARRPLTLADVADSGQLLSGADRATVYRLLTKLEERGILRRLGLHDRAAYYTMIFPGQHNDYLICTKCGRIQRLDISCPVVALEQQIAAETGYRGLYHELEFFGLCPDCTWRVTETEGWSSSGGFYRIFHSPMSAAATYKIGNEKLIKILPNASERLRGLLKKQGREENGALRVAVVGGGCSGLQYKMDLVDGPANRDILVTSNEVRVVIDPKSALFVSGSELDYSDDLQSGGFKVKNPNAVVTCSCGESFAAWVAVKMDLPN